MRTKSKLDEILLIPKIINRVENILTEFQYEDKSPFYEIDGELVFWIDSYGEDLEVVLIEVVVDMSRHHPTQLRFRGLFERGTTVLFTTDLLKFTDCLHMESKEHLEEIKELIKKRIEELQ